MTILAQPLDLTHGTLPNRIAKSAMSERIATDGRPTEELIRLYERWAPGGAGLLITGNVMIDRRYLGESGNVVVEDDTHLGALRAWADTMRAGGARAWMQINHPGRQTPRFVTREPVAPSAVALKGAGGAFARPRALTDTEIGEIIDRFAATAAVAVRAGFDGVQIHGAHGYLVSQFLSPYTNRRSDAWGGDPERRRRFLLEVVRAVRAAVGDERAVGLKLNSADFQRGGFTMEESLEVVRSLEGVDLLEISGGTYEAAAMFEERNKAESTRRREAFFLDYAERVREVSSIPLMVTGGFRTRAGMEDAIASGATDVVGLARPLAVEPDLPGRLLDGTADAALPIRLAVGIKKLDALIQGGWYQLQLDRMGRGHPADPKLSRVRAVINYVLPRRNLTPFAPPTRPEPREARAQEALRSV
jgi:2,4-dienoyl-CoA reductase-like NADH-dependent reductase (Old Yellow Enzyme family)